MTKTQLESKACEYLKNMELNTLKTGGVIYDMPLFGYADASDPLFSEYRKENIVGKSFMPPVEWLAGAKSVISIFLPFSELVKSSNIPDRIDPSIEWLHGRYEGQMVINELLKYLAGEINTDGFEAVAPTLDERFKTCRDQGSLLPITSSWSERHVAYICGLGTFGLSKGLITEKGIAGRIGSLVTTVPFEATVRKYREVYEYCSMCGACGVRCPAEAISVEKGKDQAVCERFVNGTKDKFKPMYGCGKCQTGVPCQNGIPGKNI